MNIFLEENEYVDYSNSNIINLANKLFKEYNDDVEKTKIAYEYVRDEVPHSFDINAKVITAKASDVLKYKTGICHAKANLLAALLRSQGIMAGFCFEHLTLVNDDSEGYCIHGYNAVFLNDNWIKLDARGNKPGVNAQFSMGKPILAFPPREEYDEYYINGIFAEPHKEMMKVLDDAKDLQYICDNIPDYVNQKPDIEE